MQRPSRGPFALLGTAAALGVGVRAIKKARPFQAYNALNPLNSMVLPASLASFELAAESTYSNCPNCKPQFWDNLPIKELVICGIFFVGVVLSGQAAVAAVSAFIFKKVLFWRESQVSIYLLFLVF
ncbi:hypothetical protein NADE_008657 [Nannochloris sp. 'desiccata']|nr:hypothetical protein NADE_008657 [Chlorella desiccata (nom. nud.)]